MPKVRCAGWWEQSWYGRQAMDELVLNFSGECIEGSGVDMVGRFTLTGFLRGNQIYLLKQYIGQHQIEYHGTSVGEGAYGGLWSCDGIPGENWFISVVGLADDAGASGIV